MIKNLSKNLLGAAALSALVLSIAPASAAHKTTIGCGGDNMAKVNDAVSALADSAPNKWDAIKEVGLANTALSEGKPGECAVHLSRAEHEGTTH